MSTLLDTLKDKLARMSQISRDALLAGGLFVALTLQFVLSMVFNAQRPPHTPAPNSLAHSLPVGTFGQSPALRTVVALLIIALACSALLLKRKSPWGTLIVTSACASLYTIMPLSPVFIVAAPLIAIYHVTASSAKSTRWVIIFIATALALCISALTYATARWAIELVGFTLLLAAAALFGSVRRSDLAYIHEAQQRALEAERTREQEAQKRVEAERVAIAREVHDIVAHSISIIAIQSAAADTLIDTKPAEAHEAVNNIRETSKQALTELRGMINVLRNDATNLTPLTPVASLPAIDEVIERVRTAGIDVTLENNANEYLPAPVSISAYRIIQEALTNILRHSNATAVTVRINQGSERLALDIEDNGTFDPSEINISGHGLEGMRERSEALGGTLTTSLSEEHSGGQAHGFAIHVCLPLTPNK